MTLPTLVTNHQGNIHILDGVGFSYDAMTNTQDSVVANHPRIVAGTGAPTFAAPVGTLYIRKDGSSTSTRMYVSSVNTGTWVSVTTSG